MEPNRPQWSRSAGHREFQRTYKACISCRSRKAKCELGGNPDRGIPPGPPCLKCRREQRSCEFTEKRAWERKKRKQSDDRDGEELADGRPFDLHSSRTYPSSPSSHRDMVVSPDPHRISVSGNGEAATYRHRSGTTHSPNGTANGEGISRDVHIRPREIVPDQNNSNGLANSVMRTVVSSGNDALNILFQAVAQEQETSMNELATAASRGAATAPQKNTNSVSGPQRYGDPGSLPSCAAGSSGFSENNGALSAVKPQVLALWEGCRFVKMGWFSAREAVMYVDMFFRNMAPSSPILSDFYSHHRNHYWLVTQEPVLCCTILMISSRYHVLPGIGGASRAFFIHQRLWQHCQHLIMRVMLGQEKGSQAKTRTVGTIEALLLMSEWHPRALHFPPESDGWDADLITSTNDVRATTQDGDPAASAPSRWLEDVIEPARRSDRMSWMLLGSGLTLAHELGIFDVDDSRARSLISCPEIDGKTVDVNFRRQRIQQLLYVFINQLASRLGCMSLMPQSLNHSVFATIHAGGDEWSSFMTSWIELTKLVKSVTDMFFPSATFTRQQLHSGRYIGLLDHFRPLLLQWREKYLDPNHLSSPLRDMIFIEYQYARVYTNSIGMQAVVERVLAESDPESAVEDIRQTNLDEIDYEFIQEVIDGSCSILDKVTHLAEAGSLRFSPVRTFLRITSSSIFLIKALSLGVKNAKLQESLETLGRSIQALRCSSLDDIHLASRYATLLEVLVSRLRRSFVRNNKPSKVSRGTTRPSSTRPQSSMQIRKSDDNPDVAVVGPETNLLQGTPGSYSDPAAFDDPMLALNEINADDWLSLPFDPSMAPFGTGGNQAWSGVEGVNLNFIWNTTS